MLNQETAHPKSDRIDAKLQQFIESQFQKIRSVAWTLLGGPLLRKREKVR